MWIRASLSIVLAAGVATPAAAWGRVGHRLVNRRAVETLPPALRAFFQANAAWLAEHSIDPDLWRWAGDEGEARNHFIDADAFGAPPFAEIPLDEEEHLRRHGPEAAQRGRAPWRIAELHGELAAAFRAGDARETLRVAAVLGHYVADLHVPLHAALNYDGQLTGQKGVHARWESQLVSRFETRIAARVRPAAAGPERDPLGLAFALVRESFVHVDGLLRSDRESTLEVDRPDTPWDERYDDGYYLRFHDRERERLIERLTLAAERLGGLWLGAWESAGRPEPPRFRFGYVRGSRRAVLLSLDGAGERLIAEAIARGTMPELERLRRLGATAAGVVTTRPAKTAPAHAALFTGAWSDRNGITGNVVAVPGAGALAGERGFASKHLRAEPIWATAAREGLDVTVVAGTQSYPFEPYFAERRFGADYRHRLTLWDGYGDADADETVLSGADLSRRPIGSWPPGTPVGGAREIGLELGGTRCRGLIFDDPEDPRAGFDTLLLSTREDGGDAVRLKPDAPGGADAFRALRLAGEEGAVTQVRLFELSADGHELLLLAMPRDVLRGSRERAVQAALAETGGFVGNGARGAYSRGLLGRRLWDGGDGTAEERYLETVALVVRQLGRLNDFASAYGEWDLLVTYLPYPDEAYHLWLGRLEPRLSGHDPVLAARLQPYLDRVLRLVDGYLAEVARLGGDDAILAIGSDHGQIGANRRIKPNAVLAAAGLLELDAGGGIDVARSRAVYHPGNSGFVTINRRAHGGPVAPEDEEQVRGAAAAALLAARDPETGGALVVDVLDASRGRVEPGVGGPTGGDLYLVGAPGYYASGRAAGAIVESMAPVGVHLFGPERPEMRNTFTISGPGVAAGATLGVVRQVDVAPTLAALLGIGAPADADGAVLAGALAWPDAR